MRSKIAQARYCVTVGTIGLLTLSSSAQDWEQYNTYYTVPYFPSASDVNSQGLARVINRSPEEGEVHIYAVDDAGLSYGPVTLSVNAFESVHFNSANLESSSVANALSSGIGPAQGDWRLWLSSALDIEVLSYVVSSDGFLTAMHDTAPSEGPGHRIATFNPADNTEQPSLLRLTNFGETPAPVAITGIDDSGRSPGDGVTLSIGPGASRTLSSSELESGLALGLNGSLGDGIGKWQLLIESSQPVLAMSLLPSPTGHLTNLSTASAKENDRSQFVPLFPSASDFYGRQGLVRVVNRSESPGTVTITAHDRSSWQYEPLTLAIGANEAVHFDSNDLELGNAEVGLTGITGPGQGHWWLELSSELDIEVLSYIRTIDGSLNAMHDTAPREGSGYRIAIFNPGTEVDQVSLLRLVNPNEEGALAVITGIDDQGLSPGTEVHLTVPAGEATILSALELETGTAAFEGALGDGSGKWQLSVRSETDLIVASLLSNPTGHLTNLSTVPAQQEHLGATLPDLEVGTPSVSDTSPSAGDEFTLSVTVRNAGTGASAATTLRYFRSTNATISTLDTEVGTDSVEALAASGSSAQSSTLTAPMLAGTYYFGACVDTVAEESETTDNCSASVKVEVEEASDHPDLEVGSPSVGDTTPTAGAEFALSVTVRNVGDGASTPTTLRYYRSTNATISTLDTEVGTDAVEALAASGTSAQLVTLTAPQDAGAYYYGACVDAVTGESETTDNCSASVKVDVEEASEHPDLEVGSPSVSDSTPAVGEEFTLSVTVRNAGDGDSSATTLRYYRSTNAIISTLDTEVGTDAVGVLPASGSSAELVTLTTPQDAGAYYYGACVDTVTGESETTDNCSASVKVDVEEASEHADLEVGSPSVSDGTPAAGGEFTLSVTVRNAGDGDSAATTLRYYRSTNTTISIFDTEVGTDNIGALVASGTSPELVTLMAPQDVGAYYYGACVDAVAGESDTTDNCSASVAVEVEEPAQEPDLEVSEVLVATSPDGTYPGGSLTLSATVRNAGSVGSAATTLRYYRSTNATISRSDTSVGTDAVGTLSASGTSAESISLTAPSTAGTYYYGACVDSVTGESSTANNCSTSVQVDVAEPEGPDLVVGTPTVSDNSPETGDSFTLSATVRNGGDGESAATTLRYYRSTDATISASDTSVGTDAVGTLAASGTSAESINLTAPSTAGTYYYGACVDSVTGESSTANNCSTSVQVVVEEPESQTGPDLAVGTPTVSDSSPETGDSFTLSATVRNAGDGESSATTLRYYRSTDATISSSDTSVGTDAVGTLSASGTSAESISVTAPATAGTYYYGACVDSVTGESSTADNCSGSVTVTVEAPAQYPDLEVGTPTVSDSSPETGASFTLSATVRNAGDGESAATTLRYYRSTDATITTSDTSVGTDAVGTLAASGTSAESISLTAPATAGTYYYGACVDSVTGESDTADNCSGSVTVTVEAPAQYPDLAVGTPTVSDSSPETGASFTLSATVRNAGDGASAATTLRYYRSTDATISSSDTSVGTDAVGTLAASGTSAESISVTAPSTAGTYYYGACVDSVTGESDATNNCSGSVQVTVSTAPAGPDLTVYAIVVTTNPGGTGPGGRIGVSAGVENEGDESSPATTLRVYQSTDATITTADTQVGTVTVGELSAGATTSIGTDVTAPASGGTYYYGACVDSVTGESSTANNCSTSVQVDVAEPEGPDLVVGTPTVSDNSPETGDSFTLSATVRNGGDGESAATTLRYYRSMDATISSSDTSVGTDAVGTLAASGTSAESISVTAPATAGTYYYGACVDSVTGESSTANNCSGSVTVTVEAPAQYPDLAVGTPTVSDSSPETGDSFTLSATVRNTGDGASAATTLRYYRSTGATISSSDTSVGTDAVGTLAASGTSAESISVTAPSTAGTYYYGACVDSVTGESSTANNCSTSVQVDVAEPEGPDLVVGTPTVSDSSPETGDSFTLSATVRNTGDGASAATTLRYYRSMDATISSSDTSVGTDAVGTLAASGTSAESISVTAPATAGTYYYGACVDSVTGESSTANNCSGSVTVTVEAPAQYPDLAVGAPTVSDSSPETGDSFTLSATVRNTGDGASAATTLRYYRSTDATISSSDTSVGTDAVGTLAASGTSAESISVTAPATAGTYYYGACVDSVTGESSTANNCSGSVTVTVEAPAQYPDLAVGAPTVSDSSPETGDSFTLSATVRNTGDGASAATTLRYYRSTDATISSSDTSVGTDAVGTLAASGTSAESISVTAPATAGTYYYGACVDSVTGESSTANNCSGSVQVTVSTARSGPDLKVYAFSASTGFGDTPPGGRIQLGAGVENEGDESSPATTLRFYQSTDATITTADTQVGTDTVEGLSAGATISALGADATAPSSEGTYYYGACVDAVTGESDTTNNCSGSVPVTVSTAPAGPDLIVYGLITFTSLDGTPPGGRIQLGAGVKNEGDESSPATTLRFYQSTDATITTADVQVGTVTVAGVSAGATIMALGADVTAPSSGGTYYYGACVDAVTGESDTTNNCSTSAPVDVEEPETQTSPDLVVGTPTVSDSSPETGASFTLSATVRNAGDRASAATTLRYYRSTDATISSSDAQVGTDAVGTLVASGTSAESISLTAPATAGTYYYGACVDSVTDESDTTNNCSSSVTVTVAEPEPEPQPDLIVESFYIELGPTLEPDPGSFVRLYQRVANVGNAVSAATTVRYYRSTDATITTSDTQVSTDAVPELAASSSFVESESEGLPTAPGTYYYGACVDAVAGESSTANNCSRSVKVTVPEPQPDQPDLVVSASVNDSNLNTGDSFTLSATVRNDGDEQSAASTLRYYRSTDSTISSSDTQVGTNAVGALAASGTSAGSISLTAPSSAGTYYYGACVDTVAGESDITNNCSSSVTIAVEEESSGQPDLRIVGIITFTPIGGGVSPGTRIGFSASVRNYGDANSDATTLRYYRSTDATISVSDTEVGTDEVSALVPSGRVSVGIDLAAPSQAGTYYHGVCVDAVADESDTTNNCSGSISVSVTVTGS